MRPVPQAPVRPLDAGRLPRLRQHLRRGALRHLARGQEGRSTTENAEPQEARRQEQQPDQPIVQEVFVGADRQGRCTHPDTNAPLPRQGPRRPGDHVREGQGRTRRALFEWLRRRTTRSSPAASSTASGATTSASASSTRWTTSRWPTRRPTTKLLDALAKDFVEHKFDIRHLERIDPACSRTYQLSSTANETNKLDKNNFAHSYVRPMMAEVVVDVLNSALGVDGEVRHRTSQPGSQGDRGRRQPVAEPERWPTPSASSAGRRAPPPATASGPWSRPCRRSCS